MWLGRRMVPFLLELATCRREFGKYLQSYQHHPFTNYTGLHVEHYEYKSIHNSEGRQETDLLRPHIKIHGTKVGIQVHIFSC